MSELSLDHVREITGETDPVTVARLLNAARRINVTFASSRCGCGLCHLPSRAHENFVRFEARFTADNQAVPGHRQQLCDRHMARELRSNVRNRP